MVEIVLVKATVDLSEQFGSRSQVDVGGGDIHMPQVGGEGSKPSVDILSVPIPGRQSMNGEATLIMGAVIADRLTARAEA